MDSAPPLLEAPEAASFNNSSSSDEFESLSSSEAAAAYMKNFENILEPGKEPVITKEYKPKIAYEFDKYLNPQLLKDHVLHSQKLHEIIGHYAQAQQLSRREVEKQAKLILDEIGLDRNLAIIRWCGMAISAIGKRISTGIYVNRSSIELVKKGLGQNPVLYLPSHRSYLDFTLMSYICFHYDIEIPGIAAGMDFHAMFGMGTMLRKTGAFFMRRSFSNDELYWDIFREYMYALVAFYHIGVEFFIEGTRSRNFKALVPKIGLLSMALLPYFTGEVSDITIVPVSVSYDRVLEEQLFVYELLGVPKPKESTKGFFKALKIIDERFGKMYLDFGAPISVKEFFGHQALDRMCRASVGAHLQKLHRSEVELVKKLANEIIYQQQYRIVISTFNLVSLYYASQRYAQRAVNIDELARSICQLKQIFEQLGAHVATNINAIKPEIIETIEIHANILKFHNANLQFTGVAATQLATEIDAKRLKAHSLSPQTMALAVPTLALQLYINPCLFWLARPAYLIMAALEIEKTQNAAVQLATRQHNDILQQLRQGVHVMEDIFKCEFIMESNRDVKEFNANLKFLQTHNILKICAETGRVQVLQNDISQVILSALAPFLCLYYQLAVTLNMQTLGAEFKTKELLVLLQDRVEQLLQQPHSIHVHPYCLALDNLTIALSSFVQDGYLQRNRQTDMLCLAGASGKSLQQLEQQLLQYCELMPFRQYYEPVEPHSVQWDTVKSKL